MRLSFQKTVFFLMFVIFALCLCYFVVENDIISYCIEKFTPLSYEGIEENNEIITQTVTVTNENISKEDNYVVKKTNTTYKTLDQRNDIERKELEKKYGINIKYGNEVPNYKIEGETVTKITDKNVINTYLSNLKSALSYYPDSFFKEKVNNSYKLNLTLYLVQKIDNKNTFGYTSINDNNVTITLALTSNFKETFHHEIMHYIETFIKKSNNNAFSKWQSFNPEGFKYGNNNENNISFKGIYFVNYYGKISASEDRATIFEDLMTRENDYLEIYSDRNMLGKKARYLIQEIDKYFETVSSKRIERWERFI